MRRRIALALFAALAPAACNARPPNGLHPESRDISPRYTADVRQVFAEAFAPDVALRMLEEPAFDPEHVVAIRKTAAGWRVFTLQAGEQVWGWETLREMKARNLGSTVAMKRAGPSEAEALARRWLPSVAEIPVKRCERPLPAPLTDALVAAWQGQIRAARPEAPGASLMMDAAAFHFAAADGAQGVVQAMAWSPQPKLPAGRLAALASMLEAFCRTGDPAAVATMTRQARSL